MQNRYLDQVKQLILTELGQEPVGVLLFGSRARGDSNFGSDVDVALVPKVGQTISRISLLREKIEDSCIPYKVDLVNLSEVSEDFKQQVLKDAIVWKN